LGIARLISAFANTLGGFVIFGVHDEKRTGGHNSVHINTDKLRQSIIAYMSRCPDFQVRHYDKSGLGKIDCLFVRPRKMGEPPYRFVKETKYKQFIWVRDGHNVSKAEPRHIPLLYCRVDERAQIENMQGLSGSLPPSPRTIGKFIGRLRSMDYLFDWLYTSDEPLTYLYGKGGSGKTTIAHEFASVLKRFGANIRIYNNESIDLVLFLSAKEKTFVPGDDSSVVSHDADLRRARPHRDRYPHRHPVPAPVRLEAGRPASHERSRLPRIRSGATHRKHFGRTSEWRRASSAGV
jgi:Putative DNA-binding domain